jgi:hypothetical protein
MDSKVVKSFKAFDKDLKCRGYQYEVGKTYNHDGAVELCGSGFHACENPADVFRYYEPATSRFCEVEQSGAIDRGDDKTASEVITIKAEIGLAGLLAARVSYTLSQVKPAKTSHNGKAKQLASNTGVRGAASNTGVRGAASNTGVRGAASNTGGYGAASNTGGYGAASNTGDCGAASNTGDCGAASNTGGYGAASNTGDCGAASNTGGYGAASNTGDCGAASNTGVRGAASNTGVRGAAFTTGWRSSAQTDGEKSVAVAVGYVNKAKATKGNWLVLAFRDEHENIKHIKAAQAGVTKGVKPDTYYELTTHGTFKEVA